MMDSTLRRITAGALALVGLALAGCGGGGGGAGSSSNGFLLADVRYGRLVNDGSGDRLVSPLTTVAIDPVTGNTIPGSLQGISPDVDLNRLQTFGIGSGYLPRVVPRNGVFELTFTGPIAPASIIPDTLDASGNVLSAGSVQIRFQDGRGVPVEITQVGPNKLWINPVTPATIGFPPSPVDFGPSGEPRADATGFLRLIVPRTGATVLQTTNGRALDVRRDKLGDPSTPIGFNPGNRVLDFIAQNQLIPTNETFNGFLPDTAPPRIVRTVTYSHVLDFTSGDGVSGSVVTDLSAAFSALAKNGLGEWAGTRFTLRPGLGNEETHTVTSNTRNTLTLATAFTVPPADGDTYKVERAEFFEPDLNDPIDPARFDPNDPENANNTQLVNFVEAYEIDANGNAVSGPLSLRGPVPPFSELRVRFSEPMAAESFGVYENFQVRFNPDQGAGSEILSQVLLNSSQNTVTIRPAREDQAAGTFQIVGWGKSVKSLTFALTTVPKPGYLQQQMSSDAVQAFLDLGYRSVTDLGGQPLAFPDSIFNSLSPQIVYSVPFTSDEAQNTQSPAPVIDSWGVIVHRMQGKPITGVDPATGNPGVKYQDQVNYYTPIADVNLQANGFLAGSPVVFLTKIHDDFFPPPHGQFGAFPLGAATPLASFNTATGPQPHDGARFQTVYRDIDASPSRDALAGTLLDLYRVSWAPIGGNVTTDAYSDISIHCAHSPLRPITTQNSAAAAEPYSGLSQPFDFAAWQSLVDPAIADACAGSCSINTGPNYWDTLVTTVQPGTGYKISQSNLFAPPFDGHPYCPWPTFDTPFQYNNGDKPQAEKDLRTAMNAAYNCSGGSTTVWFEKRTYDPNPDVDNLGGDSLLLEVRIRPQGTNVSRANGFTFSIGVLLDSAPNFRVYSLGSPSPAPKVHPDNIGTEVGATCAIGNTTTPGNANPTIGDNDRYFAAFDYVKTTSKITSPYVKVFPSNTAAPDYYPAIIQPDAISQPAGTSVLLEFEGANNNKGGGGTGFSTNVDVADGRSNIGFRATFVGNTQTLLLPNFDLIAIPYLRPSGT